jgi:hypothetical protein
LDVNVRDSSKVSRYQPTNSAEQSTCWEASSHTASQEITVFLKVHYRVHNSPLLVPTLSQIHPIQIFPLYFPKIYSNIILSSTSRSSD